MQMQQIIMLPADWQIARTKGVTLFEGTYTKITCPKCTEQATTMCELYHLPITLGSDVLEGEKMRYLGRRTSVRVEYT